MTLLNEQIKKIAKTSATVLIHGESGTGKELVARQIHMQSPRNAEPFIAINMAAIPENLIESEFFGHRKGSFTGADNDYQGKFLASHEGTLFLDEISEIPLTFQAKLLRVLQDYSIQPIGTTDSIKINSRFLAATNKNLPELVASSQFREDLYYRLNIIELQVPPFRERLEDLELLVEHFIKKHGTSSMSAPSEFLDILRAYSWPGNVRELENVIHRCIVLSEGDVLDKFDLPESISGLKPKKETPLAEVAYRQLQEGKSLGEIERDIIIKAIHEANGNKTNAAKLLKITRRKLYSRMEKHGIEL
jgi:DNA-binding NtrC family response regulator